MQKTFNTYMDGRRPITVKIEKEYISFHFKNEGDREFYWLGTDDWISDKDSNPDSWRKHMLRKSWFTKEMEEYIDENTKS